MKAGEHKGIDIYFDKARKNFRTGVCIPPLRNDSYNNLILQMDTKLKEEEKDNFPKEYRGYEICYDVKEKQLYFESQRNKSGIGHFYIYAPTYDFIKHYINLEIYKIEEDKQNKNNSFFRHCRNYNKLSPEDKTLIENLIKLLNEKN